MLDKSDNTEHSNDAMSETTTNSTGTSAPIPTPRQLPAVRAILSKPEAIDAISKVMPKHMTADRLLKVALLATVKNPKLLDCTPASVYQCVIESAALGLEVDGRRAHLVPYGKTCTLVLDYKGIVELCRRNGDVSNLHADVVCEHDEFTYDMGEVKAHKIDLRKERGEPFAVYCIATMRDGSKACAVMSRAEVEAIRARSRSGRAGPWVTDWAEMAKKTVFKRLSKWLTLSPEIKDAIDRDNDADPVNVTPQTEPKQAFDLSALDIESDTNNTEEAK